VTSEFTTTLHETLQNYTLPGASSTYFTKVFKGNPGALMPTSRPLARWLVASVGEPPEGPRTMGNVMRVAVFRVFCYWPLSGAEGSTQDTEDDILRVMVDLPPQLIDPTLDHTDFTVADLPVAALTLENVQPRELDFPPGSQEVQVNVFQFEIHARLLEES
jgi:hypothetical protein